jgi:hypothetical protein
MKDLHMARGAFGITSFWPLFSFGLSRSGYVQPFFKIFRAVFNLDSECIRLQALSFWQMRLLNLFAKLLNTHHERGCLREISEKLLLPIYSKLVTKVSQPINCSNSFKSDINDL